MNLKLGKKPARHAIAFRFGDFFDPKELPKPPPVFGHAAKVENFHMLGNDQYGNCVWAGAAHEHMLWSVTGGAQRTRFLTKNVLSDYAAVTGFDPLKPSTDEGTDVQVAASYRRKIGVLSADGTRRKIDSYLKLRIGNCEELALAIYLTGATGIGLQLPAQAMDQFDLKQPWSVPAKPRPEGGHYVSAVGRKANGNFEVVTWGRLQEMTPEFYMQFSDENCAYLSLEILGPKQLTPEGFDLASLRKHLAKL